MKKVVLITGGSEGLGYEIAKILAPKHTVIINAPDEQKLKKVAKAIKCEHEAFDVSDHIEVQKAADNIIQKYGGLDCLINNAGIWTEGKIENQNPHLIKRVLEVNALGPIFVSRAFIPSMKNRGSGTIINVVSQDGLFGKKDHTSYCASKFALTGFTKSLEAEVKEYGIKVIGIYPGLLKTGLFEKIGVKKDMSSALEPAEVAKLIKFIVESDSQTTFPGIEIKFLKN
ncbi:MAG: SDR family oxidoreductase [Minisyncoccia bacterium]